MFACVSADDDDSVTGYSHRDKRQVEQEDEIINKVLEEAMRLKKRCKVLTNALSEAENKAIADKKDDEAYLQKEISMELSRVTSTHEFDMAYLRDTKDREINDLYRKLDSANAELDDCRPLLEQLTKSNEELKTELNVIHFNYEKELKNSLSVYEKELKKSLSDHEAEKKSLLMRRDGSNDDQRSAMLRRAMIAENESQRLLQECNDLQAKIKDNLSQEISSIDTDSFAMDVKKIKVLFEECKKEKDLLTVECQTLSQKLEEVTNEKETVAVALLALRNLPQFSASTCPSSPRSFHSNNQPRSLSDLKESLNSLEAERVRLESKCSELGEALEEALDDTSELEDTVRELIEGKNAVTDAVIAVQIENKTLKEEVKVLKGVIDGTLKGSLQDTAPNIPPIDKRNEIHHMSRGIKNALDNSKEDSHNRFFCSPPNTPVSFVSKSVSHGESLKTSNLFNLDSATVAKANSFDKKTNNARSLSPFLSPIAKSDTGNGKKCLKSNNLFNGTVDNCNDNISACTDDSMVNSSVNSRISQIDKFGIISDTNNFNDISVNSHNLNISTDNKQLTNSIMFNITGRTDNFSRSVSPLNSRGSSGALKNVSTSHSGSTIKLNDRPAGTNEIAGNFSRSASPLNSRSTSGSSLKINTNHGGITTTNGSANNFSIPASPLTPRRSTSVTKKTDSTSSSRSASPFRSSGTSKNIDTSHSGINIDFIEKPSGTDDSITNSNRMYAPPKNLIKTWEENPLRTSRDPSPVRGPSPSRAGLPLASNATIPQDKKMLPPSGKNVKLLNALFSNAKPTTPEIGHHSRSDSALTDNEDNIDEIPSVNNSLTPDIIPVTLSNGKAMKSDEIPQQSALPSASQHPTTMPARPLNKNKDKNAQTIASNYFFNQLPPPRSGAPSATNNTNGVKSLNPSDSNSLMANIIASHPPTNHLRRTSSGIPNFLSNFSPPKRSMNKSTAKGSEEAIKPPSLTPRKKQQSQQGLLQQ